MKDLADIFDDIISFRQDICPMDGWKLSSRSIHSKDFRMPSPTKDFMKIRSQAFEQTV